MKSTLFALFFAFLLIGCGSLNGLSPYASPDAYKTSKEFDNKYNQYLEDDETKIRTWYHYVQTVNADGVYKMRSFFDKPLTLIAEETYQTQLFKVRQGASKTWWDNGFKKAEGTYRNNKMEGFFKNYYRKNGKRSSEGKYVNDKKEGDWKFYDSKGRLLQEIIYKNGKAEGNFIVYDTLGNVFKKGVYKDDEIVSEEFTNPENKKDNNLSLIDEYVIVNKMPEFPGGQQKMLEFIYSRVKYPNDAKQYDIQGLCVVSFTIEKDGSLTDIEAVRGLCSSIRTEAIRIVKEMPKWEPGYQNGEAVKVHYNLPIRFKLQ